MENNDTGFIDIHSHFLPGLDDGPEHIGQCVETARKYREIGFEKVIATPHHIPGTRWAASAQNIHESIREVEGALSDASINLRIIEGMEIALTLSLCRDFVQKELLSLGGTRCFLVECSFTLQANDPVVNGLPDLVNRGDCSFILAHPERCDLFQEHPDQLDHLVDLGALIQVNTGSVLGLYGKKAQEAAFGLFRRGLVHFLATDSHGRDGRMPPDRKQLERLYSLLGEDIVRAALRNNPLRMLEGREVLPLQHDPAGAMSGFFPILDSLTDNVRRIFRGS